MLWNERTNERCPASVHIEQRGEVDEENIGIIPSVAYEGTSGYAIGEVTWQERLRHQNWARVA